jgi:putative tryptophan/tyrosine transport system substrate-binding protein
MMKSVKTMLRVAVCLAAITNIADAKTISAIFFEGCEKTCEGFKQKIESSKFSVDVTIIDLKQDKSKIKETVAQLRATKPDLVLVYGTSATLGTIGTLDKASDPEFISDIPVVFTAVADPVGSKLVKSLEDTGRSNVTGTFNRVPEKLNIQAIKSVDASFNQLGMLYHSNEANSVAKMKELTALGAELGFAVNSVELKSDGKNPPAVEEIAIGLQALKSQNVKWLYIGSSSFLNANGKVFTETATRMGIAVVSPYPALVTEQQALISIAAPREEVGALAAEQALKIIRDGAKPSDLPIEKAKHFVFTLNMKVAKQLNVATPANADPAKATYSQDFFLSQE